jgi:GTP cyclohydrolase FolE2
MDLFRVLPGFVQEREVPLTCSFGVPVIRIVDRRQSDAIERDVGREMRFVEDLSRAYAPDAERCMGHRVLFLSINLIDSLHEYTLLEVVRK